jgi:hypothetical protein
VAGGLAVLAAAALLAACTAKAEPQPLPEPTATPTSPAVSEEATASERPEVEKPMPPDAMRRDDVAGAEAAAQYFLQLYPYVYATGDVAEWKAMSHPDCVFCDGVASRATEIHDSGGRQIGGSLVINRVDSRPPTDESAYFAIWVDASESPVERTNGSGETTESFDGGLVEFDFALMRSGDSWLVRGVDARSVGEKG